MADTFIVTGGAGFIGSNLVEALNRRGETRILIVDNLNSKEKERNLERLHYTDYLDKNAFRRRFLDNTAERVDAVFHLGACSATTETDRAYLADNNVAYTRELCEWCLAHDTRFVYASSAATYGDGALGYSDDDHMTPKLAPLNPYGQSKQMFDTWALEHGVLERVVGLKYFNVYGPFEDHKGQMRSLVPKAFAQIVEAGQIELFRSHKPAFEDGEQERDFLYVRDAVDVTLFFLDHPELTGLFNAGTGVARTWLDLAAAVFAAMGREPRIVFVDMPEAIRDKYQYHTQADISKLRAAGYDRPFTPLEDGIRDYVRRHLAGPPPQR